MVQTLQPTIEDIRGAQAEVSRIAHHTPLLASRTFSTLCDAQVYLKCENLQRTGSFKIRGAANRIAHLTVAQRKRGVIAASAGNHAQGVALASRLAGVPCTVVMPKAASITKVQATRGYGAEVLLHGQSFDEAQAEAHRLAKKRGLTFVPAFDDPDVIAGQGTVGLEICQDLPDVEAVVVPVGGGGLIGGVALAVKAMHSKARVYGVQAKASPAAANSFQRGRLTARRPGPTIADGISVGQPGEQTFALMKRYVDDMVTVSEEETAHTVVLLLERAKLLVEGAGAVGLAALLGAHLPCKGKQVVAVLSGGNLDPPLLGRILDHGLAHGGRYLVLRVVVRDTPGQLARLFDVLARAEANVVEVVHQRHGLRLPVGLVQVEVTAETRDAAHAGEVAAALQTAGYLPQAAPVSAADEAVLHYVAKDAAAPEW